MKERIIAIICFVATLGWSAVLFYGIKEHYGSWDIEEIFIFIPAIITCLSWIYYIILTKFGKRNLTELKKIDYENQLLMKKIEQQELLKKLDK